MNLVVDTNIFISALIKDGLIRKLITSLNFSFLFPEFEFIEIKNNLDEIITKSKLEPKEFLLLFRTLLKYVKIIEGNKTSSYKYKAIEIIGKIDIEDAPFIAAALATNSAIWSDDKHFKKQSSVKVYSTKEILSLISKHDS